jgi:hypothetical protein
MKTEFQNNLLYFAAVCKCGHGGAGNFGRGYYVPVTFHIMAVDAKSAAKIARNMPRVKHHSKTAILEIRKIDREEYYALKKQNDNDLFLTVTSIQEQRRLVDMTDRICYEEDEDKNTKPENEYKYKTKLYGKTKIKNPRKYFQKYYRDNTYEYDYEVS